MAELPESLKKYLPGPLLLLLAFAWWLDGDKVKEWLQKAIAEPPANILIQDMQDNLHVVRIKVSSHTDKPFEEARVEVELKTSPSDISGELATLDATHTPLLYVARSGQANILVFNKTGALSAPIRLKQGDSIEIRLHEAPAPAPAVVLVSIYSTNHEVIASSDLNQRYRLPEAAWRAGLLLLGICGAYFFFGFLVRLFSRRARKQLEEDIECLHKCWQGDATAMATFDTELQPVIDAGTAKYLKAFAPVVRDNARTRVIPQQIFERAETLPQFRRSLKGEVQRFVITFCLGMVEREYKALKNIAKKELARIR